MGAIARYYSARELVLYLGFAVATLVTFFSLVFWSVPNNFPKETTIRIEKGSGVSSTADFLHERNVIHSKFWFKTVAVLSGNSKNIIAGDYYFKSGQNVFTVISRISRGEYDLVPLRITVPEGLTVFQTADLMAQKLVFFDKRQFALDAPEGYLFPDTYFFMPNATHTEVIEKMKVNFDEKLTGFTEEINGSGRSFGDIIIMASIIEKEALFDKDREIVSGVLWNRINIEMPLQVDAAFSYVNGKHTYTLTKEDLFDESPYNTYRNKGLPPTAIANPGIDSIVAALRPAKTPYYYFLSDLSGNMYYAEDFEGHQRNRERYLRK